MSFTGGINFNPEKNNFEIIKKIFALVQIILKL